MDALKTLHFNRIKTIIENEDNDHEHLSSITNMIKNFELLFGKCNLLNSLNDLKLKYLQTL